jgi:hypothetical protein
LKGVISVWLVYHLLGLIVAPASIPPSSELVQSSWVIFGPYLQVLNMNQGNHFFAPDPGASTIVRYKAERADGSIVEGQIPHRGISPRLMYHRHFMLTESLGATDVEDTRVRPLLVRAMARQLCRELDARAITLTQTVHLLPSMQWRRAGRSGEDPEMYQEIPLGRFLASDFEQSPSKLHPSHN